MSQSTRNGGWDKRPRRLFKNCYAGYTASCRRRAAPKWHTDLAFFPTSEERGLLHLRTSANMILPSLLCARLFQERGLRFECFDHSQHLLGLRGWIADDGQVANPMRECLAFLAQIAIRAPKPFIFDKCFLQFPSQSYQFRRSLSVTSSLVLQLVTIRVPKPFIFFACFLQFPSQPYQFRGSLKGTPPLIFQLGAGLDGRSIRIRNSEGSAIECVAKRLDLEIV
jgi:hypothetical protein